MLAKSAWNHDPFRIKSSKLRYGTVPHIDQEFFSPGILANYRSTKPIRTKFRQFVLNNGIDSLLAVHYRNLVLIDLEIYFPLTGLVRFRSLIDALHQRSPNNRVLCTFPSQSIDRNTINRQDVVRMRRPA